MLEKCIVIIISEQQTEPHQIAKEVEDLEELDGPSLLLRAMEEAEKKDKAEDSDERNSKGEYN